MVSFMQSRVGQRRITKQHCVLPYVCVCVCVRERERERERENIFSCKIRRDRQTDRDSDRESIESCKIRGEREGESIFSCKIQRERERERAFSRAKYKIYVTSDVIDVIPQSHAGAVSSLALHSVC